MYTAQKLNIIYYSQKHPRCRSPVFEPSQRNKFTNIKLKKGHQDQRDAADYAKKRRSPENASIKFLC